MLSWWVPSPSVPGYPANAKQPVAVGLGGDEPFRAVIEAQLETRGRMARLEQSDASNGLGHWAGQTEIASWGMPWQE